MFLADNPGVLAGTLAERQGILRHAARMFAVQHRLTVPKLHVTLRKAFGFGSSIMAMNPFDGQTITLAFPSITLGALPASSEGSAVADPRKGRDWRPSRPELRSPRAAGSPMTRSSIRVISAMRCSPGSPWPRAARPRRVRREERESCHEPLQACRQFGGNGEQGGLLQGRNRSAHAAIEPPPQTVQTLMRGRHEIGPIVGLGIERPPATRFIEFFATSAGPPSQAATGVCQEWVCSCDRAKLGDVATRSPEERKADALAKLGDQGQRMGRLCLTDRWRPPRASHEYLERQSGCPSNRAKIADREQTPRRTHESASPWARPGTRSGRRHLARGRPGVGGRGVAGWRMSAQAG